MDIRTRKTIVIPLYAACLYCDDVKINKNTITDSVYDSLYFLIQTTQCIVQRVIRYLLRAMSDIQISQVNCEPRLDDQYAMSVRLFASHKQNR